MGYLFGKELTFTYYPIDRDGNVVTPSGDAPTIYLFGPDEKPARDAAADGTGALQTVSSWSSSGNGWDVTIAAISDPDATGEEHTQEYWLGVNYTLETSEDVQTDVVRFEVSRPLGYGSELNIGAADLEKYFEQIDGWISDSDQADFVSEAVGTVKAILDAKQWEYWMLTQPEKLRYAVINRALYRIALSQSMKGEDGFELMLSECKEEYENALSRVNIELDTDGDGDVDETGQTPGAYAIVEY